MLLIPRKEFSDDEIAESKYLARPVPVAEDASCQVSWYL